MKSISKNETPAYTMQRAYLNNTLKKDAIEEVLSKHPECSRRQLSDMWDAIDAYIDVNDVG